MFYSLCSCLLAGRASCFSYKQKDIHYMNVMHLQDGGMSGKNTHYPRKKAPLERQLRDLYLEEFERSACHWPEGSFMLRTQFVCCKWRFFFFLGNCDQHHYFQAHVNSCIDVQLQACAQTHKCNHSQHLIRLSFPWSFLWCKKRVKVIAVDKWPKQTAFPLWQGSVECN